MNLVTILLLTILLIVFIYFTPESSSCKNLNMTTVADLGFTTLCKGEL